MPNKLKILYMSDLHLEFHDMHIDTSSVDIVVLAGDIHTGNRALNWIKREIPDLPVLYVLGNHEFYNQSYSTLYDSLKIETEGTNINILEREAFTHRGVNFFGCTLWTDFKLFGNDELAMKISQRGMNDFRLIQKSSGNVPLSPKDVQTIHYNSREWLDQELGLHSGQKNIVVTHHGPSICSVAEIFKTDPMTPAFVSDLEALMKKHKPNYWIHGHVHNSSRYSLRGCEVRVNTRGYPNERGTYFRKDAMITI